MSGLEIAGVILGAFPLIISGLEHWRDVLKAGGLFRRMRQEYLECLRDVQFHEMLYKRNLEELLLPIVRDVDEVARLVGDPGGRDWSSKALQERLEERLQESYDLYRGIICEMNHTAEELRKELGLDNAAVQSKLAPSQPKIQRSPSPQPSKASGLEAKISRWDYEKFRFKFIVNKKVRNGHSNRLKECNERLRKLLEMSDRSSAIEDNSPVSRKQISALGAAFKQARKKSDLLFQALQNAWQCSCQQYHFANLRLEHRTLPETCFEIILMSAAPSPQVKIPWSWRELECGQIANCSLPQNTMKISRVPQPPFTQPNCTPAPAPSIKPAKRKQVTFSTPAYPVPEIELEIQVCPSVKLCQLLGNDDCDKCMGIIGQDDETYHLHPLMKRQRPDDGSPLTLDRILSNSSGGHPSRRQRYYIALLLASSAAQLQSTPWLRTGFTKEDILFFSCKDDARGVSYHEPFIRQGFSHHQPASSNIAADYSNFSSLGILLLELCFGRRLEDHPLHKKLADKTEARRQVLDRLVAKKWSKSVGDEGGSDYASAVEWCFTDTNKANQSWRREIIKNVIAPLEMCLKHFEAVQI